MSDEVIEVELNSERVPLSQVDVQSAAPLSGAEASQSTGVTYPGVESGSRADNIIQRERPESEVEEFEDPEARTRR